jgi:AhpD family alkylhydroperoxidase
MAVATRAEVFRDVKEMFGQVPAWLEEVPESALAAFWGLERDFYLAETKIPNKYKELIGIGVSGATRCKYCALFHTEAARLFGATDEEIAEASMMAGVTMCASTFLNAQQTDYERFAKETREIVEYVKNQQMEVSKQQSAQTRKEAPASEVHA